MKQKPKWEDMSPVKRKAVVVVSVIEVLLTGLALVDLARRPAALVRGPKRRWTMLCFVQPVGSIAYLALGRRSRPA